MKQLKSEFNRTFTTLSSFIALLALCFIHLHADEDRASARSAFEIYSELQESATTFNARAISVGNGLNIGDMGAGVTWGAEKEASSGLITRIMGPTGNDLQRTIGNLSESQRKEFLSDFFHHYMKNANGYRTYMRDGAAFDFATDLVDGAGNPRTLDLSEFRGINFVEADLALLEEKFARFVQLTDDNPLSFIRPSVRMKMFKGSLPGLNGRNLLNTGGYNEYAAWRPLFGPGENYIRDAHNTSVGWEINFKPNQTYGEFEQMVAWFRKELENAGKLFQAPGHQRMVFRVHPELDRARLSELYRAIQSLIIVEGIKGNTGIESASFKSVLSDNELRRLESGRGVIRLEGNRFGADTMAVEFRAGTKDLRLARFYQTALAARVAANDFSGLAGIDDYQLINGEYYSQIRADELVERFDVGRDVAEKAVRNLNAVDISNQKYLVPFWRWEAEGITFLSAEKKQLIRGLTKGLIEQVAEIPQNSSRLSEDFKSLMRGWVKTANLSEDLHRYILPKRAETMTEDLLTYFPNQARARVTATSLAEELLQERVTPQIDSALEKRILAASLESPNLGQARLTSKLSAEGVNVTENQIRKVWRTHELTNQGLRREKARVLGEASGNFPAGMIDVNQIDLGIEFSGRMPLKLTAEYTPDPLSNGKKAWLQTYSDLTIEERERLIRQVANDLGQELGATAPAQRVADTNAHGHGLDIAYEIRDSLNRKWVVEWDGIGRSYTELGEVVSGSARGGSIELITPKFVPKVDEMEAVFRAFKKNNILPRIQSGGGHINVDLAAFDNKPRALARFLSIFHEHRGIISLMFQRLNRLVNAEPANVSSDLARELSHFDGTADELKTLLYEERYFNQRYGRKTRYIQIDVSAYFQDVIPEEFITQDFDIKKPTEPWRRQFKVDPNIRKLEFRLFNAPRDATEAALQIRLVRAMLHKALNDETPLSGRVQTVDHEAYLRNPQQAFDDFERLMRELNLNPTDFRGTVAEGLSETDLITRSAFYEPLSERLRIHPIQRGWGEAVRPRTATQAIASEGRQWVRGQADSLNTIDHEQFIRAAREADAQRSRIATGSTRSTSSPANFRRTDSCVDLVNQLIWQAN